MTRTDVHSPLNLITEDYTYVWAGDNQERFWGGMPFTEEGLKFVQKINASLSLTDRGHEQCHHCGAHLRYAAILLHHPTGEYIAVGETCLENRFERASSDFHALRKAAELDRKEQKIKNAARTFLAESGDLVLTALLSKSDEVAADLIASWNLGDDVTNARTNDFVSDVRRKLWTYGELSDRQVEAVKNVPERERTNRERQAARDAEVKVPAPEGRLAFTGVVVSRKFRDNDFGGAWKLTIKVETEAGVWLCWVSEPKSIEAKRVWDEDCDLNDPGSVVQPGCEVGDTVTMTATLTRSDKDPSFCFGKRPAAAEIVERAA